ncbi:hypothetical protein BDD12DRAFT_721796 [Trichophaea hybrida]|nr:hypothetical protein BDD12DRAFT_721796 [Trichophaea hybrida]
MSSNSSPSGEGGNPFVDDPERTPSNSNPAYSCRNSTIGSRSRGQQEVRFGNGEALDLLGNKTSFDLRDANSPGGSSRPTSVTPTEIYPQRYLIESPEPIPGIDGSSSIAPTPRTSISVPPRTFTYKKPVIDDEEELNEKYDYFAPRDNLSPQERVARLGESYSAPNSVPGSPTLDAFSVGAGGAQGAVAVDIPLLSLTGQESATGDQEGVINPDRPKVLATREAVDLVRQHTRRESPAGGRFMQAGLSESKLDEPLPGYETPITPRHGDYVRKPEQFRGGVLGSLLTLYNNPNEHETRQGHRHTRSTGSLPASGRSTPKWYSKSANNSSTSLGGLLAASGKTMVTPVAGGAVVGTGPVVGVGRRERPKPKHRPHSGGFVDKLKSLSRQNLAEEIRIIVHIAETLQRQRYIIKICRALMLYGAPTHRLEEALKMTSRVLEIDGQFLYLPGCMIISFGDQSTHTSDMQIVRAAHGVDLGKLHDCHLVYKEVVHDIIGVEEATKRLDEIMARKPKHNPWIQVLLYGVASATVGPFGFRAGFIDMPILFVLGCILGFLQLIVAPRSDLYANVFEITAAILTSFLARAFGSVRGGTLFCFSALSQASIALILPGYIILCGSLELQSKNMVAGSVRMFYAIIYSLFLGFGITIGSALYGLVDNNATSSTTCQNAIDWRYNFIFVSLFALCLLIINQAKWRQAPLMVIIALAGYVVNYFSSLRFGSQPQVANSLGAFTVGILGNVYARVGHGLAFAAMLPAIFVQVPSGLAAQGSLLSGIESADALVGNTTTSSTPSGTNSIMFEFGFSMIQVAIGITVGLFAATLVVYPFGKKRSGLFSF